MEVWRDRNFAEKMARRVSGPSATPQRNPGYDRSIGNRRDDLESRITQPLVGVSNCHLAESPVRHFFRRIHDAAAGMGGAAAKIQAINRCVVVAPAWNRAHGSELMERHASLEDVPSSKPKDSFEIDRREHLPMENRVRHVGCKARDFCDAAIGELLFDVIQTALCQLVGSVLHKQRDNVMSLRASVLSTEVGMVISTIGLCDGRPNLASS